MTVINTITNSGLFNVTAEDFQVITESGNEIPMQADLSGGREPITVIIDIPEGTSGEFQLSCKGGWNNTIPLSAGKLNVMHITSYGLREEGGMGNFLLSTTNESGFASLGVKIAFIKYIAVINN